MNMDTLGQAIDKDKHFWFNIVSIKEYFLLIYMNFHRLEERKKCVWDLYVMFVEVVMSAVY